MLMPGPTRLERSGQSHSYFQASEQVDFVGATRTYNSNGYKEIEWTIEFKDYENDFGVQYYYRDNATNSIGYNNTGMTLKVDTTSPDYSR